MTENQATICPVCNESYITQSRILESGLVRYTCERCGTFQIEKVFADVRKKPWDKVKHLVSAWVRRENKMGNTGVTIASGASWNQVSSPEWWDSQFRSLGFPQTISEKLDALLVAYGELAGGVYDASLFISKNLIAEIAANDLREVGGLTVLLEQLQYIKKIGSGVFEITAKGWLRIEGLHHKLAESNFAFVAMWFSEITVQYRKAVVMAIEYCGYKPIIVDQQEFNDFVMNQVVLSIKQSRFLIADFTTRAEIDDGKVKNGVRGGVYWEAGMAYGLGIPVIHTCEDSLDARNRIHFDVNQYNTIFWKPENLDLEIRPIDQTRDNPNFVEKLAARILTTVGRSTNTSKK